MRRILYICLLHTLWMIFCLSAERTIKKRSSKKILYASILNFILALISMVLAIKRIPKDLKKEND